MPTMTIKKTINAIIGFTILIAVWQLIHHRRPEYDSALFPTPWQVGEGRRIANRAGHPFCPFKSEPHPLFHRLPISSHHRHGHRPISRRLPSVYRGVIDPIVQVLRPVSPIAWSPFIVLWFGIGDIPAIVIIFIAAFFPVLLSTAQP